MESFLAKMAGFLVSLQILLQTYFDVALLLWYLFYESFQEVNSQKDETIDDYEDICLMCDKRQNRMIYEIYIGICLYIIEIVKIIHYWDVAWGCWCARSETRWVSNSCARFSYHDECWGFASSGEWLSFPSL